jgi:hypothetical protein
MQNNCTNCVNSNTCKSCEVYKKLIRESNKELSESNKRIKLLENELNDLKKQKFFATNNKSYDLCNERHQREILQSIHNNLSDPLKKYFESYGLRPKLLTVKSSAENHLIDFEKNFHRRNVGEIEVNKYVSYANMNSNQRNTLRQQLSEIQKNHI